MTNQKPARARNFIKVLPFIPKGWQEFMVNLPFDEFTVDVPIVIDAPAGEYVYRSYEPSPWLDRVLDAARRLGATFPGAEYEVHDGAGGIAYHYVFTRPLTRDARRVAYLRALSSSQPAYGHIVGGYGGSNAPYEAEAMMEWPVSDVKQEIARTARILLDDPDLVVDESHVAPFFRRRAAMSRRAEQATKLGAYADKLEHGDVAPAPVHAPPPRKAPQKKERGHRTTFAIYEVSTKASHTTKIKAKKGDESPVIPRNATRVQAIFSAEGRTRDDALRNALVGEGGLRSTKMEVGTSEVQHQAEGLINLAFDGTPTIFVSPSGALQAPFDVAQDPGAFLSDVEYMAMKLLYLAKDLTEVRTMLDSVWAQWADKLRSRLRLADAAQIEAAIRDLNVSRKILVGTGFSDESKRVQAHIAQRFYAQTVSNAAQYRGLPLAWSGKFSTRSRTAHVRVLSDNLHTAMVHFSIFNAHEGAHSRTVEAAMAVNGKNPLEMYYYALEKMNQYGLDHLEMDALGIALLQGVPLAVHHRRGNAQSGIVALTVGMFLNAIQPTSRLWTVQRDYNASTVWDGLDPLYTYYGQDLYHANPQKALGLGDVRGTVEVGVRRWLDGITSIDWNAEGEAYVEKIQRRQEVEQAQEKQAAEEAAARRVAEERARQEAERQRQADEAAAVRSTLTQVKQEADVSKLRVTTLYSFTSSASNNPELLDPTALPGTSSIVAIKRYQAIVVKGPYRVDAEQPLRVVPMTRKIRVNQIPRDAYHPLPVPYTHDVPAMARGVEPVTVLDAADIDTLLAHKHNEGDRDRLVVLLKNGTFVADAPWHVEYANQKEAIYAAKLRGKMVAAVRLKFAQFALRALRQDFGRNAVVTVQQAPGSHLNPLIFGRTSDVQYHIIMPVDWREDVT